MLTNSHPRLPQWASFKSSSSRPLTSSRKYCHFLISMLPLYRILPLASGCTSRTCPPPATLCRAASRPSGSETRSRSDRGAPWSVDLLADCFLAQPTEGTFRVGHPVVADQRAEPDGEGLGPEHVLRYLGPPPSTARHSPTFAVRVSWRAASLMKKGGLQ